MHDRNGKSVAIGNTRTRFQRTADAKFFHGRVRSLTDDILVVTCLSQAAFATGEKFAFNVYCSGTDLFFFAIYTGGAVSCPSEDAGFAGECLLETEFSFKLDSQILLSDCKQEARYFPRFMTAVISNAYRSEDNAKVVDVSDGGLSISCREDFDKGSEVRLEINAFGKTIQAVAEVRYCVRDRSRPGFNRIGLKLSLTERIDEKRWQQVVNHLIDQSRIRNANSKDKDHGPGGDWMRPVIAS